MNKIGKKIFGLIRGNFEEPKYRKMTSDYDIQGCKRIYLVHIRKTGGTSLNHMFLSLGNKKPESLFKELIKIPEHRLLSDDKVFVGWNVRLINRGNYFYAFSHTPFHKLCLPDKTFIVTCFRDPVKRLVSHYNMLMGYALNNIKDPCMKIEGKWLGNSFDDFLDRIPPEHLLNQLYMFSGTYNVDEAIENVKSLSHFMFSENFDEGIEQLITKTGLDLKPLHSNKAIYFPEIPEISIRRLKGMLKKEYLFLEKISNR